MNKQNPIGTYGYIAMKRLKSAEKNLDIVNNRIILNDIAHLKENWNDNTANSFPSSLIEKCTNLINQLEVQPFISPTACGSNPNGI